MSAEFGPLLLSLGILAIYVAVHALGFRYGRPQRGWAWTRNLMVVCILGCAAVCAFVITGIPEINSTSRSPLSALILAGLIYLGLLVGYLTFYAFIDRSLSVRTFVHLLNEAGRSATVDELLRTYDPQAALTRRIDILVESGYLRRREDALVLTGRGKRTAWLVRSLKQYYRLGPGG